MIYKGKNINSLSNNVETIILQGVSTLKARMRSANIDIKTLSAHTGIHYDKIARWLLLPDHEELRALEKAVIQLEASKYAEVKLSDLKWKLQALLENPKANEKNINKLRTEINKIERNEKAKI